MLKKILALAAAAALLCASACGGEGFALRAAYKLTAAVGIAPQAAFVEKVAGDLARVITVVPPGNNPETFSPSSAQMKALSDADVYFTLNLPAEQANILPKLYDFNANILLVDLQAETALVYPMLHSAHGQKDGEATDFHTWLSPKRAIVMVQTIADTLSGLDEANSETYQANAAGYIKELTALNAELKNKFAAYESKAFIIYHAAYAYFADDYGLEMIAIEIEGKKASAADMRAVIELARERGIKTIFYQREFDANQASTIAQEIGGVAAEAAPLSKDYIDSLRDFAAAITGS
ncbi:MAG: zinc ABC transporter substrate-binding protein [Christensenellales bacterium]